MLRQQTTIGTYKEVLADFVDSTEAFTPFINPYFKKSAKELQEIAFQNGKQVIARDAIEHPLA